MNESPTPTMAAYEGGCVANIVPALFGLINADWMPEPVRDARAVVLFVVDGLGANAIESMPEVVPTLAQMTGASITTVLPATTSAALTSITTGTAPSRHGIVGYRTFVESQVLNVLRWQVEGVNGRGPVPSEVQRQSAFRGRPVPVCTKSEFKRSGFTVFIAQ